ncbi:MAG TPA: hypothetical protein VMN99_01060 [Anaerolineales bacterium]|nr:hypothetical protein [Anaerolineales bacterium]
MSGYKRATITISEQEYRRLHQADMKRKFGGLTRTKAKEAGQTADLANTVRQIENRQRQLEQSLSDLNEGFNQLDAEVIQDILTQNALCYESLAAIIEETASDANDSLAILSQRFTEEMQREREQYRHGLHSLVQRLDSYGEKEQVKETLARQWLRQSVGLADFIQEQFEHERFLPGKLARVLRSLDFAQNNLAQGFLESGLQISQQAFLDLSELHLELEQRVMEWQSEYERTCSAIRQVLAELELNAKVNALGLQGEELAEQVDLAYWTNGKYHQLIGKCRQFLEILAQDHQSISTAELTSLYAEILPVITESFESIVYEARLNALNSQLRMNIAETALRALETHGFKLSEAGYVREDMRAPFKAHLDNPDGSRVMIEVLPTDKSKQELTNELIVITNHPHLKTEQEARMQWDELCRSLNQYNLNVSRPEIRAMPPPTLQEPAQHPPLLNEQLIRPEKQNHV